MDIWFSDHIFNKNDYKYMYLKYAVKNARKLLDALTGIFQTKNLLLTRNVLTFMLSEPFLCCIVLSMFIFHLRESKLYHYILDGTYELAWELPFPRSGPPVFHIKVGAFH